MMQEQSSAVNHTFSACFKSSQTNVKTLKCREEMELSMEQGLQVRKSYNTSINYLQVTGKFCPALN